MKTIKTLFAILFFGTVATVTAQEARVSHETRVKTHNEKLSYYQHRGAADAKFELEYKAKSKAEEKAFWKEQKEYEKDLKQNNRRAYRIYLQSKQEAYAEHHHHCNGHSYHSDYFYDHATVYYHQYDRHNYERSPRRTSVNTQIGVRAPSVRLGVF